MGSFENRAKLSGTLSREAEQLLTILILARTEVDLTLFIVVYEYNQSLLAIKFEFEFMADPPGTSVS